MKMTRFDSRRKRESILAISTTFLLCILRMRRSDVTNKVIREDNNGAENQGRGLEISNHENPGEEL
jgi:hypothetical protein